MGLKLLEGPLKTCACDGIVHSPISRSLASAGGLSSRWRARTNHRKGHSLQHVRAESQLQDLIVGGAVLTAITATLVTGLKGEPKVCDLCQGVGGTKCFACDGSGAGKASSEKKLAPGGLKRDFVGRVSDPQACRVCGGSGTNLCSKCKGSGYMSSL